MVATQNIDILSNLDIFTLMAVCVILRGQQIYTVIQAVHSLTTLYCGKVSFLQCCHM